MTILLGAVSWTFLDSSCLLLHARQRFSGQRSSVTIDLTSSCNRLLFLGIYRHNEVRRDSLHILFAVYLPVTRPSLKLLCEVIMSILVNVVTRRRVISRIAS
jgi:hypothetical protein